MVTGASSGIGKEIARQLAAAGLAVYVGSRTVETNVFGVVALTNALLPALRRSAYPRIVNVSSGTGSSGWSTRPSPNLSA